MDSGAQPLDVKGLLRRQLSTQRSGIAGRTVRKSVWATRGFVFGPYLNAARGRPFLSPDREPHGRHLPSCEELTPHVADDYHGEQPVLWAGLRTTAVDILKGSRRLRNRNPKRKRGNQIRRFSLAYASGYDDRASAKPAKYRPRCGRVTRPVHGPDLRWDGRKTAPQRRKARGNSNFIRGFSEFLRIQLRELCNYGMNSKDNH